MKLLIVCPFFPYPLDVGGKVAIYNNIKQISRNNDITFLCLLHPQEDKENPKLLEDICKKVIIVKKTIKPRNPNCFLRIASRLINYVMRFSPFCMPSLLKYRYDNELKTALLFILKEDFDLICYEFTQSISCIVKNSSTPQVLVEYDIMYLKCWRQMKLIAWTKTFDKLTAFIECLKIRFLETRAWRKVDHIITMTEIDKDVVVEVNPSLNVTAIPRGVDTAYYVYDRNEQNTDDKILFVGSAVNTLNIDAVKFFLREIWPKVLSQKPSTEFIIIGNGFTDIAAKSYSKNVKLLGFVEDMRPYLKSSKVFVVPLLNGSGIRMKILEAMSAGCPIVTTSIGREGINLVDGKDAFIRDDPEAFADAILILMDNAGLRNEFSKNAREKIVKNYTWALIGERFNLLAKSLTA
ncbi:MAG: glycosyltransferase family 4 protein [Candidatus Omnitrophota bacterium]